MVRKTEPSLAEHSFRLRLAVRCLVAINPNGPSAKRCQSSSRRILDQVFKFIDRCNERHAPEISIINLLFQIAKLLPDEVEDYLLSHLSPGRRSAGMTGSEKRRTSEVQLLNSLTAPSQQGVITKHLLDYLVERNCLRQAPFAFWEHILTA
jgi:hypothetical protein